MAETEIEGHVVIARNTKLVPITMFYPCVPSRKTVPKTRMSANAVPDISQWRKAALALQLSYSKDDCLVSDDAFENWVSRRRYQQQWQWQRRGRQKGQEAWRRWRVGWAMLNTWNGREKKRERERSARIRPQLIMHAGVIIQRRVVVI